VTILKKWSGFNENDTFIEKAKKIEEVEFILSIIHPGKIFCDWESDELLQ